VVRELRRISNEESGDPKVLYGFHTPTFFASSRVAGGRPGAIDVDHPRTFHQMGLPHDIEDRAGDRGIAIRR
jgi:hypothetical protein